MTTLVPFADLLTIAIVSLVILAALGWRASQ